MRQATSVMTKPSPRYQVEMQEGTRVSALSPFLLLGRISDLITYRKPWGCFDVFVHTDLRTMRSGGGPHAMGDEQPCKWTQSR
jgi:hypothetical protein